MRAIVLALALAPAGAWVQTYAGCKAALAAIDAADPHNASLEDKAAAKAAVRRICRTTPKRQEKSE